ncbi:MAG TPA: MDR family MFS transporter [Devosiaceae bacterium]
MSRLTPLILAIALFMEMMDSTVIATSLPVIASDIGTQPIALKLALTTYLVALAIFIPISGWMADRFGARNVFRTAIAVFVLGSIACALSDSLLTFVLSRFLQGMGGSMMAPLARLILVRSTPKNELVNAWAWLTIPALIGPVCGPLIGGFLTTYLSWHWIFFINVPIGLGGILLATRFLPRVGYRDRRSLDVTGFLLSGIGLSGVVFGLSVMSLPALPPVLGAVILAAGVVSSLGYYFHAKRAAAPLLDLGLFREPVYRTAIIGGSIFRLGIGAMPFLMPLMLQISFGLSPFQSGLVTFVGAMGAIALKLVAQRLYAALGFRTTLIAGSVLSAATIAVNGLFTPETPLVLIAFFLFVGGLLRSAFFTGLNVLSFSEISEEATSHATAISSVAQQISVALGVALAGGLLEVTTRIGGHELGLADFHFAFLAVALVALSATASFLTLDPGAGSESSGHRRRPAEAGAMGK